MRLDEQMEVIVEGPDAKGVAESRPMDCEETRAAVER